MNALFFFAHIMPQIQPELGKLTGSSDFSGTESNDASSHPFAQLVDHYSLEPEDGDFSQSPMSVAVEKLKLQHPFFSETVDKEAPVFAEGEKPGQGHVHSPLLAQVMQSFAVENEDTAVLEEPLIAETTLITEIDIDYIEGAPQAENKQSAESLVTAEIIEQAEPPVQQDVPLAPATVTSTEATPPQPVAAPKKSAEPVLSAPIESDDAPPAPAQNSTNAATPQKPQNAFGQIVSELAQNKEEGPVDPKILPQHPGQNQVQHSTTPTSSVVQIVQQMDGHAHQSETQITKQASNPELAKEVGVEIAQMAKAGKRNFSIRLDPPEMGRIDIRMTLGQDSQVKAVMTVEHERTLDVLQRDLRSLERALEHAGFKPDNMTLNLSLKHQGQGQTAQDQNNSTRSAPADGGDEELLEDLAPETIAQLVGESRPLDLRI